jgi:hypothetical protein
MRDSRLRTLFTNLLNNISLGAKEDLHAAFSPSQESKDANVILLAAVTRG